MNTEILAVVAGQNITDEDYNAFVAGMPREQQQYAADPRFKEQCLEQLISVHLFAKKGEELKLEETEEFAKIIANAKRDILAQMAMREVLGGITVTEEEMQAHYEANKQAYAKGETVSAKHILVDAEEKCNEVLASINAGEKTFEDAAKEFSSCPSGQRGGDLGEFGKGQMVKEFEDAAFTAEIGQVVGPVQSQFGYHLIKVEKKNEATVASFDEVKETIRRNMLQQKQNSVYTKEIQNLKEKYIEK